MAVCVWKQGLRYHWPKRKKMFFFFLFHPLCFACNGSVRGCEQRGGTERPAGGRCASAASDARPETSRHRAGRICSRGAGMHTKCCAHEEWQETACEQPAENTEASRGLLARRTDGRAYSGAHLRRSSDPLQLCMNPPLGLRLQSQTGRCWRACVPSVRAPFSASTTWHFRQDGVNDLHEIYRRISAVRGAGEVRAHIYIFFIISFNLSMKCHAVM